MEDKERQRYILFKIIAEEKINKDRLIQVMWRQLFQLYGESGTSQTGLWLAEYEEEKKYGILRTNIKGLSMVRSTLAIIRQVDDIRCILVTCGVSGTIKTLKEKHLEKVTSNAQ